MFANEAVKAHVYSIYGVNLNDFAVNLTGVDHHEWFKRLGNHVNTDENALINEVARIYARSIGEAEIGNLPTLLKEAIRK